MCFLALLVCQFSLSSSALHMLLIFLYLFNRTNSRIQMLPKIVYSYSSFILIIPYSHFTKQNPAVCNISSRRHLCGCRCLLLCIFYMFGRFCALFPVPYTLYHHRLRCIWQLVYLGKYLRNKIWQRTLVLENIVLSE